MEGLLIKKFKNILKRPGDFSTHIIEINIFSVFFTSLVDSLNLFSPPLIDP